MDSAPITPDLESGTRLPQIAVPPPGPRSRQLAGELRSFESPNVTYIADDFPIFWERALGANVVDVDGNVYVDLTAAFGVAAAGHRNPRVTAAIREQLDRLIHGMGDVHPPAVKAQLLRRLAEIAPDPLRQSILASSGAEAVEAALKTARLATGRPGVICFSGAYHGLTYGALAVTDGERFREPFRDQLGILAFRVPFPGHEATGSGTEAASAGDGQVERATRLVVERLAGPGGDRVGAIIVEPIQARGGVVSPPNGFLRALRSLCDERDLVLIFDEVYTGFGRTGRWFACQHEGVVPDLLCLGKALTGGMPFSACIGTPEMMAAWPPSPGEAMHTSTFLGHPLGCAAALAQIEEIRDRNLVDRAATLGRELLDRLGRLVGRAPRVGGVRGRGLLLGIELVRPESDEPDRAGAARLMIEALRRGVLLLGGGAHGNVITLSPPITITEEQLDHATAVIEDCLSRF